MYATRVCCMKYTLNTSVVLDGITFDINFDVDWINGRADIRVCIESTIIGSLVDLWCLKGLYMSACNSHKIVTTIRTTIGTAIKIQEIYRVWQDVAKNYVVRE